MYCFNRKVRHIKYTRIPLKEKTYNIGRSIMHNVIKKSRAERSLNVINTNLFERVNCQIARNKSKVNDKDKKLQIL